MLLICIILKINRIYSTELIETWSDYISKLYEGKLYKCHTCVYISYMLINMFGSVSLETLDTLI